MVTNTLRVEYARFVQQGSPVKKLISIAALCILTFYCGKKQEDKKPGAFGVAVSIFPIYDIARNIGGDRARIFFVIPAGADPHTFEPRPSVAAQLQDADLFIGVSPEFDGWVERYLPGPVPRRYLIAPAGPGGETPNPHRWLSVRQAKAIAERITRFLSGSDRGNAGYYRANLGSYAARLDDTDAKITALFRDKKNRSFIQWHEAWNYFAADYGLVITGTVQREGSDRASVATIKNIVERARRERVRAVVTSLSSEDKGARVLADEIGGRIVRLDGIGDPSAADRSDYLKLMYRNAKALADAME